MEGKMRQNKRPSVVESNHALDQYDNEKLRPQIHSKSFYNGG